MTAMLKDLIRVPSNSTLTINDTLEAAYRFRRDLNHAIQHAESEMVAQANTTEKIQKALSTLEKRSDSYTR